MKFFFRQSKLENSRLTIAIAHMVIVKSGPREKIIRKMKQPTKDLIANGVGNVITTAADTNKMAQSKPEKWGPISAKNGIFSYLIDFWKMINLLPGNSDENG